MFGEITNSELLGGWTFKLEPANKLPQELASAFVNLLGAKFGGSYIPEFLVGTQLVNGINYKLIVKRQMLVSGGKTVTSFADVVINIPSGDARGENATIVSETDATDFVLRDEIETGVKKALAGWTGCSINPLIELGTQVVKGMNYIFVAECKGVYPGAEPYLARVAINNFQDNWTIDEIERI